MKSTNIWAEKYRPSKFEDYISGSVDINQIKKFVKDPTTLPHLLFISASPGTGKTSLAQVIINELGADALILNSSSDRKIETVRDKIMSFASTNSFNPSCPKIIFLDEADGLPTLTQEALRNVMETFVGNCRFILTANNSNKIIDPIKSRCVPINFTQPNKDEVLKKVEFILTSEKVTYDVEVVKKVIEESYPDIRTILVDLQSSYIKYGKIDGEVKLKKELCVLHMYSLLKQGKLEETRDYMYANALSPEQVLTDLYEVYFKDKTLTTIKLKLGILAFSKYSYQLAVGASPDIQVSGLFVELIKVLTDK